MQIWITVVVGMVVGYGLLLLVGWLTIELLSRTLSLSDFNVFKDDPQLAWFTSKPSGPSVRVHEREPRRDI